MRKGKSVEEELCGDHGVKEEGAPEAEAEGKQEDPKGEEERQGNTENGKLRRMNVPRMRRRHSARAQQLREGKRG